MHEVRAPHPRLRLPGPGAIYMDQHLKFLAPVRPGDTVHATVKVREVVAERGRVVLETTCTVKGVMVIDGQALVKVDSSARRAQREAAAAAPAQFQTVIA